MTKALRRCQRHLFNLMFYRLAKTLHDVIYVNMKKTAKDLLVPDDARYETTSTLDFLKKATAFAEHTGWSKKTVPQF